MTAPRRCAIYTRKSTEEGLEQAFNSLHAQREACEAYIKSQAHEGWKLVKTAYDDGGLSGGTLERPALQRLLAEVRAGRVNVIVVYKVDRLTRSLADFARIVETLDRQGASFVSITQQFNTTTSMGRLTLNVLLSFAQFEREVTGERIRDKIAASKRKGMWMGGTPPLGYDVGARELVRNAAEALTVLNIFEAYLRIGNMSGLLEELRSRGVVSKRWVSGSGKSHGGLEFRDGNLKWLLRNPVYVGQVRHKGQVHPGLHEKIIEQDTWNRAQELLAANGAIRGQRFNIPGGHFLSGKLFDDRGNAMSPSRTSKSNGRQYQYYVSQALLRNAREDAGTVARVPAAQIEQLVQKALAVDPAMPIFSGILRRELERVIVHADRIEIIRPQGIIEQGAEPQTVNVPFKLSRRNRAHILDDGNVGPNPIAVRAICRAYEWRGWLKHGVARSYRAIASKAGVSASYVQAVLPLAFLAPGLTRQLLDGRRQVRGSLMTQLRRGVPLDWTQQADSF